MGNQRGDNSATEQLISHQESEIARMHPDDPGLPETRRLLNALRRTPIVRRILDLTAAKPLSK